MNHRMTLGFEADAAETAALTLADERATERMTEALDFEYDEKRRKAWINNAVRRLGKSDRAFARAVLKGVRWRQLGITRQAFFCRLKKICDLLQTPVNIERNRHAEDL